VLAQLMVLTAIGVQGTQPSGGSATIKVAGPDIKVSGEYPTTLCGGPYMLGKGMVYQVKAGDYQITIASQTRVSGAVPLNTPTGMVNVIVTVNGKGKHLVRGPKNGGKLTVSADYRKAQAMLELRPVVGSGTATLVATFNCKS
jgi:hypothetical protein